MYMRQHKADTGLMIKSAKCSCFFLNFHVVKYSVGDVLMLNPTNMRGGKCLPTQHTRSSWPL